MKNELLKKFIDFVKNEHGITLKINEQGEKDTFESLFECKSSSCEKDNKL